MEKNTIKDKIKTKEFWFRIIPMGIIILQSVTATLNYQFDFELLNQELMVIVNSVFSALALVGIVGENSMHKKEVAELKNKSVAETKQDLLNNLDIKEKDDE